MFVVKSEDMIDVVEVDQDEDDENKENRRPGTTIVSKTLSPPSTTTTVFPPSSTLACQGQTQVLISEHRIVLPTVKSAPSLPVPTAAASSDDDDLFEGEEEDDDEDDEEDEEAEETAATAGSAGKKKPTVKGSRKAKSLGLLCQRFMAAMQAETVSTPRGDVHLESVAKKMSVEKRRIYDIVNVLEALDAMHKRTKSFYGWNGLVNLPKLLHELQSKALKEQLPEKIQRVEQAMCSFTELSPGSSSTSKAMAQRRVGSLVEQPSPVSTVWKTEATEEADRPPTAYVLEARAREPTNSLSDLCRRFLMVLLSNPRNNRRVSLDVASTILIKDPVTEGFDPPSRSRCRRLYDIANVLVAMGLIKKMHYLFGTKKIPLFVYNGPEPDPFGVFDASTMFATPLPPTTLPAPASMNTNKLLFTKPKSTSQLQRSHLTPVTPLNLANSTLVGGKRQATSEQRPRTQRAAKEKEGWAASRELLTATAALPIAVPRAHKITRIGSEGMQSLIAAAELELRRVQNDELLIGSLHQMRAPPKQRQHSSPESQNREKSFSGNGGGGGSSFHSVHALLGLPATSSLSSSSCSPSFSTNPNPPQLMASPLRRQSAARLGHHVAASAFGKPEAAVGEKTNVNARRTLSGINGGPSSTPQF